MHSNKHSRNCPICANNTTSTFHTFGEYRVVCCSMCGFAFQNPIYDAEHYHSLPCHYPEDYFQHSVNRGSYIYRFLKDFIRRDSKVDVLDIGAGRCEPLKYILNAGFSGHHAYKDKNSYRGTAITMEPRDSIYWADKWNMDILFFDFEDDVKTNEFIENNRNKFDFIIMSHVLEHFINPSKVIQKLPELLAPNGVVYVEVPSLYNGEYRIKSVWTPEHLSYFTLSSLNDLMKSCGFTSLKICDSKIWGNIKSVWKYTDNTNNNFVAEINVKNRYNKNKIKKSIQRMKHKLGFKYEANI